ncbi:hypothetical protein B0H12DRAFT_1127587 [Mycena haematopus]|nr:hypothetical protein B0H12DRAFT_1127587 [Mycena haematopus]
MYQAFKLSVFKPYLSSCQGSSNRKTEALNFLVLVLWGSSSQSVIEALSPARL